MPLWREIEFFLLNKYYFLFLASEYILISFNYRAD